MNMHHNTDVDECENENGECAQLCNNTVGSFLCACSDGYLLNMDGFNCNGKTGYTIMLHYMHLLIVVLSDIIYPCIY